MGPWGWSHVGVARGLRGGCCALLVGVLLCVGAPPAGASVWRVQRLKPTNDGEFTDKVYSLDNRRIYKGIPLELPGDPALDGY